VFAQIKVIIDLISFGLKDGWSFKTKAQRRSDVLKILETYFLLKDCLEEGAALIAEAGPQPVQKIRKLPGSDARDLVTKWDCILRKQGHRLALLQEYFIGQDHLAVINPELQDRIVQAIGNKFDRVATLQGIGAALIFYNMFPLADSPEEKARYVAVMSGSRRDTISMPRIKREIKDMSDALTRYRVVIDQLVTSDELVELSKLARKKTLFRELPAFRAELRRTT